MRQLIPVLKLILFVGWAVLAVLALVSCATLRPIPVVFDSELPKNYGAITTCDTIANIPVVSVQESLRNHPNLAPTLLHEMIHAKQAMRHRGGCQAFMSKYTREASFRLDVEAEAYCGVLMTYGNPSEYTQNVMRTTLQLWEGYGQPIGLNPDQTRARIMRFCPGVHPTAVRLAERSVSR